MKTRLYVILSCLLALVAEAAPYANFSTNVSGLKLTGWTTTTNPVTARAALGIVTGGDSLWTNNAFGMVSLVDRTTNNDFNIDSDGTMHGQADGWSINSAHGVFGGLTLQDQAITPANGLWELPNSGTIFATAFTTDTNRVLTVILPTNTPADGQVLTASGTAGATAWAGLSGSASNLTDVPWSWREQVEDIDHDWGASPPVSPLSYSFTISGSPSNEVNGTYYYIGTVVGDGDVHRWTNYVTTASLEKDPDGDAVITGSGYTYYYSIDAGRSKDFPEATWALGIHGYGTITVTSPGAGIAYGDQSYTNNQSLLWASNGVWLVSYITNAGYAAASVKSFPSPIQPSRFGQTTTNASLLTTGILANARLDPNLVGSNATFSGELLATNPVFYGVVSIYTNNPIVSGISLNTNSGLALNANNLRVRYEMDAYLDIFTNRAVFSDGLVLYGNGAGLTNLNATGMAGVLTNGHSVAVTVSNGVTIAQPDVNTGMRVNSGSAYVVATNGALRTSGIINAGNIIYGNGITVLDGYELKMQSRWTMGRGTGDEKGILSIRGYSGADDKFRGIIFGSAGVDIRSNMPAIWTITNATPAFTISAANTNGLCDLNVFGAVMATNGLVLPGTNAVIKFIASSNTNGPALGANLAYIFAGSNGTAASIYTMDGSGTIKMISEHALPGDAPDSIADDDDPFPNVSKDANYYLGKIRWVNRSRAARQQELLTKITLNSMANWMFLQGKTATQWSNSAAYGKYTNSLVKLDELAETSRQLVVNETFEEYRLRTGVSLQQVSWTEVQTRLSNEVFAAYSNALAAYEAALAAGDTNAVGPGSYVPRTAEPVPTWLYNRGVR